MGNSMVTDHRIDLQFLQTSGLRGQKKRCVWQVDLAFRGQAILEVQSRSFVRGFEVKARELVRGFRITTVHIINSCIDLQLKHYM